MKILDQFFRKIKLKIGEQVLCPRFSVAALLKKLVLGLALLEVSQLADTMAVEPRAFFRTSIVAPNRSFRPST